MKSGLRGSDLALRERGTAKADTKAPAMESTIVKWSLGKTWDLRSGLLALPFYLILPLVRREWKNGSNSSYNCTPFLHSLLTKGK